MATGWIVEDQGDATLYTLSLSKKLHCSILVSKDTGSVSMHAFDFVDGKFFMHSACWTATAPMLEQLSVGEKSSCSFDSSHYIFNVHFIRPAKNLPQKVQALFRGNFGIGKR